jgi:sugar phosphate isomerase/epimerase
MKLCYPVVAPEINNSLRKGRLMALYGDFETNMAVPKDSGYQGVELLLRDPALVDMGSLLNSMRKQGLELASLGTSPVSAEDKIFLAAQGSAVRTRALERGKAMAVLAGKLEVPLSLGKFRGLIDESDANNWEALKKAIRILCDAAGPKGSIAIELQQPGPVNSFCAMDEALSRIKEIDRSNCGFLLDSFHQEALDSSVSSSVFAEIDRLKFVHISDTRRLVPGAGSISFRDLLAVLQQSDYKGWLSMEVSQKPDGETAARICADYLYYLDTVFFNNNVIN